MRLAKIYNIINYERKLFYLQTTMHITISGTLKPCPRGQSGLDPNCTGNKIVFLTICKLKLFNALSNTFNTYFVV